MIERQTLYKLKSYGSHLFIPNGGWLTLDGYHPGNLDFIFSWGIPLNDILEKVIVYRNTDCNIYIGRLIKIRNYEVIDGILELFYPQTKDVYGWGVVDADPIIRFSNLDTALLFQLSEDILLKSISVIVKDGTV